MAQLNLALEINTSGYKYIDQPYPSPWIIAAATRLGIPLLFGSDSHCPDNVGEGMEEAVKYTFTAISSQ